MAKMGKGKKRLIIVGVIFVLFILGTLFGEDTDTSKEASTKPKVTEEKIDLSKVDPGSEDFKKGVQKITNIESTKFEDGTITMSYKKDSVLTEKSAVSSFAIDSSKVMTEISKNPNIKKMKFELPVTFMDDNANENVKNALEAEITKETYDQLNYEKWKDLVLLDYTKFYNKADSYWIHPSFLNKLNEEDRVNL